MKIPSIELGNISRFRAEQMGAAMLFVILFHVALDRGDPFYGLRRCGNVGVDIFLFLSGVGLWFAWTKTPSVSHFYRRRLIRILPTWLICSTAFYLRDYLGARRFSKDIGDLIGDITINWDFWLHDELTFWYVPAIMALYLVAPWYMRLIERYPTYRWLPMLMVVWCVMVQWVLPIHAAVGHLEIFWSRVPIFFIGINMGEMVRSRKQLPPDAVWLLLVTFLMTFGTCLYLEQVRHGRFPLFVERMLYIPFTVCSILVMNRIFRRTPEWVNRAFRLVGMLSLEAYLIHIHFVLVYIQPMGLGYWGTFAATVVITLPVAWVLHQTTSFALNIFSKK